MLLLGENGAVVRFLQLVVADVLHYQGRLLVFDDAGHFPDKFFRIVAEHIKFGRTDAFQDGNYRAAGQRRAFGYLAY